MKRLVFADLAPYVVAWALGGVLALGCASADRPAAPAEERWLLLPANLHVAENVETVIHRIEEGATLGFTAVVLMDGKFHFAEGLGPRYAANVRRVIAAARSVGMEVIPALFDLGNAYPLLRRDPNLAAGLPVRGAPFRVRGSLALPDSNPEPRIRNGSFEEASGPTPAGWRILDPGAVRVARRTERKGGRALLFDAGAQRARVMQHWVSPPWQAYRLSLLVHTDQLERPRALGIHVQVAGKDVLFQRPVIQGNQGWTPAYLVFNSLQGGPTRLLIGVTGGGGGRVLIDEVKLEPAGLLNVLRRKDTPVRVLRSNGTPLIEGSDYEPIRDPKLDEIRRGRSISMGHDPPPIRLLPRAGLKEGELLLVDWHHPIAFVERRVTGSLCSEELYDSLDRPLRWVRAAMQPRTVLLGISEVRLIGYEDACSGSGTAGEILRKRMLLLAQKTRELAGAERIAAWSDMFDPLHNARKEYYLAKGGLEKDWEGLPRDLIIVNWNPRVPDESLRFFSKLGHPQLVTLYVDRPNRPDLSKIPVARRTPGFLGFMYMTWEKRYGALGRIARHLDQALEPPRSAP